MRNLTSDLKKLVFVAISLLAGFAGNAQLTGIKNVPGNYATLDLAIQDLNLQGVGAGGVTINLNQAETAPVGGYSITTLTGAAASPIVIMGNGNTVTAGASPVVGSRNDAIFKIIGGDYITIQGFAMVENPANTVGGALAVQQMTEFGVALFAASATDGAQNNTIQANTITLNPTYQNSIGIFSTSSSSSTNGVQAATSTAGTNSNNKFYANNITGVAFGMYFICEPITATIFESNEDIGGAATLTGNIIQFGCNTASDIGWTRFSSATNAGIVLRNGAGNSVQFNTVSTIAGTTATMGGIIVSPGTTPTGVTYTSTISNNTVTLTNTGTTAMTGIDFGYGIGTGTIASNLNTVTLNETPAAANASAVICIKANYPSATRTCNSNTIILNQTATAGSITSATTGITEASSATTNNAVSNNITFNQSSSGTGSVSNTATLITVAGTTTTNNVQTNTLLVNQTTSVAAGMSSSLVGINATSAATTLNINLNNSITFKQAVTGAGTYGAATTGYILMNAGHTNVNITNNTFNTTGSTIRATGNLDCILGGGSTLNGLLTIKSNTANIDRVAASGNVGFYTQTSTAPNDPSDSISLNNITFTGLTTSGTVTVINRVGGSTTAIRNICNNIISVSGTSTGTVIGIVNGYSNPSLIANNSISISCNAATVTGISGSGGSPANCTVRGNTISLTSGATAPSAMTAISGSSTGPYQIFLNNITAMNFTGVITTSPTMSGIAVAVGTGNNINNNTITGISAGAAGSTASATIDGILFSGGTSVTINKNNIYGLTTQGTGIATLVSGIRVTAGTTVNINNNLIGLLTAPASATAEAIRGININSSTTSSNVNLYYNTVYINASSTGANFGTTGIFHAVNATSTTAALDMRNNLVVNTSTASGTGLIVGYRRSGTALNNYANTSNNNSFYCGTPSATVLIFNDGTNSDQTLASYQARVSPRDGASVSVNPTFSSLVGSSPAFLHIPFATATLLESGGTTVGSVTVDYDNDARPGPVGSVNGGALAPDIGADEFDGALLTCSGAVGGTISPATVTVCAGSTTTMSPSGASSGPGITYQWKVATVSGGPYSNVTGGSGATSLSYTTGSLVAGTYYYVLQVTCSAGPVTGLSNELTVTVNSSPTVTVTPSPGVVCNGSPVTLTASGATTYAWSPATGLSATTGTSVIATPTGSILYTVTGTSGGCTGTVTVPVTVSTTPTVTATATPSSVCSGGNSQLLASPVGSSYVVTSIPYAPTVGAGVQATTGDDAVSGAITLPFTFNFYGTNYTQAFVYTNGFIQLGTSTGSTTTYAKDLTTNGTPNAVISGAWSDLNANAGQITTYTTGVSPNRIFTVYYNNVAFYSSSTTYTGNTNFQILLYETSNIVEVHVGAVTGASTTTANKTLGIENAAGTASAFPVGKNAANWNVATPEAWRFSPNTFTYAWTPGTFLSSTSISNPMANSVTATTTYTATVTDLAGCPSTGTVTLTAGSVLSSSANITPGNTVCAGTNVTLNAVPTGGGAPYTYAWSGPASFTSTSQNPVITSATTAASGVYTVITTDACSATSTSTVSLTVNPLPVVAVTPATALYCNPGTPIALTATGATTYAWGPAAGLSATTGSNVNATPATTTTYTVTGTDGNGCIATATTTITSAPAVTGATASASPSSVCIGSSTTLNSSANPVAGTLLIENFNSGAPSWTRTNTSTGGTPANAAWTDRPDGFVYAAGTPYHSNDNSQFVQSNSDAQGSGSTTNTTMQSPAFSTVGYTGLSLDFYQFYRDINDNGDSAVVESSLNGINWSIVTAYSTTLGSENAFNHQTLALPAGLNNQPTVYIRFRYTGTWDWYWSIDNVSITGLSPNFTYSWTSTPAGFTSTAQNPSGVTPAVSSTYSVQITNAFGCSATANTSVTVNPIPTVTASASPTTICSGNSTTLTGSGATTYNWMPGSLSGTSVTVSPASTTTYTVTGTNASGCSNTATVTITVNPTPTVTATASPSAICTGSSSTLTGSGASTYAWMPGSLSGTSVTVSPGSTTTYTVTGTSGSCSNTATVSVTVNPIPVVTLSGSNSFCAGGSSTLTGTSGGTSQWYHNGVAIPSATSNTYVATTAGVYNMIKTNLSGCSDSAAVGITITVHPLPTVTASASSTSICTGNSVTLTSSGASTYSWMPGSLSGSPVTDSPSATTTYTVTGTDVNGCTGTSTITVTVGAQPTVSVSPTNPSVCNGSSTTLTATGTSSYNWMPGSLTGSAVTISPTSTTTYTVTGTNGPGCFNTATVTVTVHSLPTVSATAAPSSICSGSPATLTASGATSYTWMPGSLSGSPVTDTPASTTTYTVTGTDVNGCSNTATVAVSVNPSPTVAVTASPATICSGASTTMTASGADTYTWMPGSFTGSSVTDSPTATTTYTVTGTITASGCTSAQTVTVTVNPLPVVALGNDTAMCGGTITLDAQNAGATFLWNDASTAQTLTASATGTYSVTVTDVNGCSSSDAIDVTIHTVPVVALGADITQCGGAVALDAGNPGSSYLWSDASTSRFLNVSSSGTYYVTVTDSTGSCSASDTIAVTINPTPVVDLGPDVAQCTGTVSLDAGNPGETFMWSDSLTTAQTFTAGTTGIYWVDVTNSFGCTTRDSVSVIINSNPTVTLGNDTTMCGGSITLNAGNPGATYLWSDNSTNQTLAATTSGTYYVTATLTGGCTASDTIVVTINAVPVVNLGNDTTQCGGTVTLNAQNAGATYLWSDNSTAQTLTVNTTGFYYVDVTNPAGCSSSDSVMVTINTLPTVTFTVADTVCDNGGFITLTGSPAGGTFFGTGVSGNTFDPTVPGTGATTLSYSYTDINGCSASANQSVFVDDCSGINEPVNSTSLVVYPNPNNGQFTIVINQMNGAGVLEITDALGQLISSESIAPVNGVITKEINLGIYSSGMYFVRFTTNATTTVEKVNVQR